MNAISEEIDDGATPRTERVRVEDVVRPSGQKDSKDDQIAQLESQVFEITNNRYEERFIWVLVIVILVDWQMMGSMTNWAGPVVIGILELIGLVVLADRCKVDAILPLIDRIGGAIGNAKRKN